MKNTAKQKQLKRFTQFSTRQKIKLRLMKQSQKPLKALL